MIEVTAKQLYRMYSDLKEINPQDVDNVTIAFTFDKCASFLFINGEWKPTTDLIIKA
jgi:hypothetical protein